jgi:hypothetical protein
MITRAFAEKHRDCYEKGMTVEEYVEFFHDCQKIAVEEDIEPEFVALDDEDLRELARMVIELNEEG